MSSAMTSPPISHTKLTQPNMKVPTPRTTPLKRKRPVTSENPAQKSLKIPRLDSHAPSIEASLGAVNSTRHYAVYMHNLLEDSNTTASPQLITASTDFNSTYSAMRKHAASQIDANVHWGATKELNTNHLYEILDSTNRVLLRYELDTVFPGSKDANGIQTWNRASKSSALPAHYGLYIEMHCDVKDVVERFFVAAFESFGEANHAMKQAAAPCIRSYSGARLSKKCIEMIGEKGQVVQRYTVEKGGRDEHGKFVREDDWQVVEDGSDSKVPVDRLPALEMLEMPASSPAEMVVAQPVPGAIRQITPKAAPQVPSPVTSPIQAPRTAHRQSQRLRPLPQPTNDTKEELHKPKPKPKSKPKTKTKIKSQSKPPPHTQTPHDLTPLCTCRLPDDRSFMIACDNETCSIVWYHGRCIGLDEAVSEDQEWYCEMCVRDVEGKKADRGGGKTKKRKGKGKGRGKSG